ncbi:hypothetical protein D3C80_1190390 [compost metagenome]
MLRCRCDNKWSGIFAYFKISFTLQFNCTCSTSSKIGIKSQTRRGIKPRFRSVRKDDLVHFSIFCGDSIASCFNGLRIGVICRENKYALCIFGDNDSLLRLDFTYIGSIEINLRTIGQRQSSTLMSSFDLRSCIVGYLIFPMALLQFVYT